MMPFTWNVQIKHILTDRKQISRGWSKREMGKRLQVCTVLSTLIWKLVDYSSYCCLAPDYSSLPMLGWGFLKMLLFLNPENLIQCPWVHSEKGVEMGPLDQTHLRHCCWGGDLGKLYGKYSVLGRWIWVSLPCHFHPLDWSYWRRKSQLTPVSLPGESQGRRSLVGCCLWGRTELDMTEVT